MKLRYHVVAWAKGQFFQFDKRSLNKNIKKVGALLKKHLALMCCAFGVISILSKLLSILLGGPGAAIAYL